MAKLTIKSLGEKYPDFEIIKNHKSYRVKHKPTGKESVCILGKTLDSIERFIKDTIEIEWYLDNRSFYRLPNK